MREILYNFSGLMKRDTKIYSIGGAGIPGGISVNFIKIVAPAVIVSIILGILIGLPFHISFFNFLNPNFNLKYTLFWIIFGVVIGLALWNIRIQTYRLYQYLGAYFRPKRCYTNEPNARKREYKQHNIKIDTFISQKL